MNQVTTCPKLLRQRMSEKPSPLKSPTPLTVHPVGTEPGEPPPITVVPFKNQTTTWPVV